VVTDVDGPGAARTAAEIGAAAGLEHDVRDPGAHAAAAAEAARHGVLTAWFNNAGVGDDGRLSELSEEAVRRLVEVNLLGTLWGMRAAIAGFGVGGGDIVNTASLAGLGPVPGYSVYAASKAAIVSATMSVDAETPPRVRVHAVCPDGVQTAMLDGQDPGGLGSALVHSGGRRHRRRGGGRPGRQPPGRAQRAGLARRCGARRGHRAGRGQAGDRGLRGPGPAGDLAALGFLRRRSPGFTTRSNICSSRCLHSFEHLIYSRTHVRSNV
jgi:NAD(P)-dependent dehydrogenase (short-subunit alcohol dehydrogenase family)